MATTPSGIYVYVTFIRTTPEKLWSALTEAEFQKRYWSGHYQDSGWSVGSDWTMLSSDGRVSDRGRILEIDPPKRVVFTWRNESQPELYAEGESRCTYELEPVQGAVKLTVTHTIDRADSKLIRAVSGGWPRVLSDLKSVLETGEVAVGGKNP